MIVLAIAIPLGMFLGLGNIKGALLSFNQPFLDVIKVNISFAGISQMGTFIQYVILFAMIGSLESILTAKAIDLMDPFKRKSNFNKDLIAVGTGNIFSSIVGGLPMIAEVARSSANVNNGAKTRWANFYHGLFLLLFMVFLVPVLQLIPKAALAAMLIGVGFKLAHPKEFIHMYHIGKEQLLIFIVTIIFTLGVDLLVGIAAGIITKIIINVINSKSLKGVFSSDYEIGGELEGVYIVYVKKALVFSNFIGLKKKLYALEPGKRVIIDVQNTHLIDHSTIVNLHQFKEDYAEHGGFVEIVDLQYHKSLSRHSMSARIKA